MLPEDNKDDNDYDDLFAFSSDKIWNVAFCCYC